MKTPSAAEIKRMEANYKKTTDAEIGTLLERIAIVGQTHKGRGTVYGYYTHASMDEIRAKPRGISPSFGFKPGELVEGLVEYKTIPFLVHSSSHIFLKPDIGEVFDQMSEEDRRITRAVEINTDGAVTLTDPSHFICEAVLLK